MKNDVRRQKLREEYERNKELIKEKTERNREILKIDKALETEEYLFLIKKSRVTAEELEEIFRRMNKLPEPEKKQEVTDVNESKRSAG